MSEQTKDLSRFPQLFAQLTDPRDPRGVRHPYSALCSLVFLGLLARICEMAVLVRWAKTHWETLAQPLGFTRDQPPSATCISRSLANVSLEQFRAAFAEWIRPLIDDKTLFAVAIDGKTCKQGYDAQGKPEVMLNVFLQELKLAVSQFSVNGDKTNEPGCLKNNIDELIRNLPFLQLITGDAIYLQRPLLEALQEHGIDYLFQVKANQPETVEALDYCFHDSRINKPMVETTEKKRSNRCSSPLV